MRYYFICYSKNSMVKAKNGLSFSKTKPRQNSLDRECLLRYLIFCSQHLLLGTNFIKNKLTFKESHDFSDKERSLARKNVAYLPNLISR